jgi:hypothetical protein
LAVAEAAGYGQGENRLERVTIMFQAFKREAYTPPEVEQIVVRRALALIALLD